MSNKMPEHIYPTFLGQTFERFEWGTVVLLTDFDHGRDQYLDFGNDDAACPQRGCSTRDYVAPENKRFWWADNWRAKSDADQSCAPEIVCEMEDHTRSLVIRNGRLQSSEIYYYGYEMVIPPVIDLVDDGKASAVLPMEHDGVEFDRTVLIGGDVFDPMTTAELAYVAAKRAEKEAAEEEHQKRLQEACQ